MVDCTSGNVSSNIPATTVVEHTDLACNKKQAADVWNWSSVVNLLYNPIGCIKYYISYLHHSNSYGKGAFQQHKRIFRCEEMEEAYQNLVILYGLIPL